jgi:hypothetical protein
LPLFVLCKELALKFNWSPPEEVLVIVVVIVVVDLVEEVLDGEDVEEPVVLVDVIVVVVVEVDFEVEGDEGVVVVDSVDVVVTVVVVESEDVVELLEEEGDVSEVVEPQELPGQAHTCPVTGFVDASIEISPAAPWFGM